MSETSITDFLINECGFRKFYGGGAREVLDWDKYSCLIRLHELHYLYYSEVHGHFTIVVRHPNPKGLSGGGTQYTTDVMIPRVVRTIEDAALMVKALVNPSTIKLYNP